MATILGLTLVFLAVFGGGIRVWSLCLAAFVFSAGLIAAAPGAAGEPTSAVVPPVGRRLRAIWRESTGPEIIYGLMLALILFSLIPLPVAGTVVHGRVRHEQNRAAAELLDAGADQGLAPAVRPRFALTRNRAGTWRMLLLIMAAAGAMAMAAHIPARRKPGLIRGLTLLGAGVGLTALLSLFVWPQGDTLLWFFPVAETPKSPLSCFENRNHLAGFLALLCPAALALGMRDATRRRWGWAALSAASFLTMSAAVVASLSRGGIAVWLIGLATAGAVLMWRGRLRVAAVCGAVLLLALTVAVTLPVPSLRARLKTVESLETESSYRIRTGLWRDALAVWTTYPLTGAGLNAFRSVYPQSRLDSHSAHVAHAENEYLQLVAETGLVGVALSILLLAALLRLAGPRVKDVGSDDWIIVATAGAVMVAAAHAGLDFALRTPLYALTLATLIGLALSETAPTLLSINPGRPLLSRHARKIGLIHLVAAGAALWQMRDIERLDNPVHLQDSSKDDMVRATLWAPTSWHAWYYLGRRACMINTRAAVEWGERCLTQAAQCDPENYRLWYQLGRLRMKLDEPDGARAAFERVKALRPWMRTP